MDQLRAGGAEKARDYMGFFGGGGNNNWPGRGFYEGHVKIGNFVSRC